MTGKSLKDGVMEIPKEDKPIEVHYGIDNNIITVDGTSYFKTLTFKSGRVSPYIRFMKGHLFDPWGIFEDKMKGSTWVKVNSDVAKMYQRYLRTRNTAHYTHANRKHTDG